MKRAYIYTGVMLGFMGGVFAKATAAQNPYAEVSGNDINNGGDNTFVLHHPPEPCNVTVSPRPGWAFNDPQDANITHHIGTKDAVSLRGLHTEALQTIYIIDDWVHTCTCSNYEQHVLSPTIVVDCVPHRLLMFADPDIGVPFGTNCTARAGEDGLHLDITEYAKCDYPGCENSEKVIEKEIVIKPPSEVDGEVRADGVIFTPEGAYLMEGRHNVGYFAEFELEECEELLCKGAAVTNAIWDVCKLSMTNSPFLGIDLTDEGKMKPAVGFAEACIDPMPPKTTASLYWQFFDPMRGVVSWKNDNPGTAEMATRIPGIPSACYQGDYVECHVTLQENPHPTPPHEPCAASGVVTGLVTVVQVDIAVEGVDEDEEEKEGGMLCYVPDAEKAHDHGLTEEGTNMLKKIHFVCTPDDGDMTNEWISISAPKGMLLVKEKDGYYEAKDGYTVEELKKKEFRLHGHKRSAQYLGDTIEAVHEASGARDKVKITVFGRPRLVPDYDRDGNIGDEDIARSEDQKSIFRFWINDDDDDASGKGAINDDTTNIPGEGSNHTSGRVNGLIDLEDFTPLMIDLSEVFPSGTPQEVKDTVKWKMQSPCAAVVWTDLYPSVAGDYRTQKKNKFGPNLKQDSYEAKTTLLETPTLIPEAMMNHMLSHGYQGVCLMEGVKSGEKFEIMGELKNGRPFVKGNVALRIDGVEKMYRWMDLRADLANPRANVPGSKMLDEPDNGPDSDCNGIPRGDRHFLFVHGYNVNAQQARGWGATVFKRLWQSGNNDCFTVVDWYGDIGQGGMIIKDSVAYYAAVDNAFRSAKHFQRKTKGLGGSKWIIAHSLGNMLASAAIQDWNMAYEKFYMVNAAVALQAFDEKADQDILMLDPDWANVKDDRYCSHGWHKLFDADDFRSTLNWKGRFSALTKNVNCYSETDDVIKNIERTPWYNVSEKLDVMGGTWGLQERMKGTKFIKAVNLLSKEKVTREAGWGVNSEYYDFSGNIPPANVQHYPKEQIKEHPLFYPFVHEPEKLMSTKPFPLKKNDRDGYQYDLRSILLADAIPATTFAVGANESKTVRNLNLADQKGKDWPRKNGDWLHSDIKNVAYYFEKEFYDQLVNGESK